MFRVSCCIHKCTGRIAVDLPGGPPDVLIRVEFENQLSAVCDLHRVLDCLFSVLEAPGFACVRRAYQHIAPVWEVVVEILSAIVKVRYASDTDLFTGDPFAHEVVPVSLAGNAENLVGIAQPVRCRACNPPWKPLTPFHKPVPEPLRVCHPLLD